MNGHPAETSGRVILSTERLILREMTPADLPVLRSMLQDIEVMHAWEHAFSESEVQGWLERTLARYRQYGCGHWLAVERESGEPVGQIGLIPEEIEGRSHLGIGWMLRKEFQHRGYATEGARECLDFAFRRRNAGRVIADIRPENESSLRVAARLGMLRAGRYEKPVGGGVMVHDLFYIRDPEAELPGRPPASPEQQEELRHRVAPGAARFGGCLETGDGSGAVARLEYLPAGAGSLPALKAGLAELGFYPRTAGAGIEWFTETLRLPFRHDLVLRTPDEAAVAAVQIRHHRRVREGYDRLAGWIAGATPAGYGQQAFDAWIARLPAGGSILELGCGWGRQTRMLLDRGFRVTGVDFSGELLKLARRNAPGAVFHRCDAMEFRSEERFDGVLAWDSLFHLAIGEHGAMLRRIASWLEPGGCVLMTGGVRAGIAAGVMQNVEFPYSSPGRAGWEELIPEAGLRIVSFWEDQSDHLVIVAEREPSLTRTKKWCAHGDSNPGPSD